jgi:hypothetical protein
VNKCLLATSILMWSAFTCATAGESSALDPERVSAIWRTHEASFRFRSEQQRFRCEELSARLQCILHSLGAHLDRRSELACSDGFAAAVSGTLIVHTAVEATPENVRAVELSITAKDRLVSRVNGLPDPRLLIRAFPAQWQGVSAASAKLDLGDCELLQAVEKQLAPLLTVRDFKIRTSCRYGTRPNMSALALIRVRPSDIDVQSTSQPAMASEQPCDNGCEEQIEVESETMPAG